MAATTIKCIYDKGTAKAVIGAPVALNAWTAGDAERAQRCFESAKGEDAAIVCDSAYLELDYNGDLLFGSRYGISAAGALKALISDARRLRDFDKVSYFSCVTDCTASISTPLATLVGEEVAEIASAGSLDAFFYGGGEIAGIACATDALSFKAAARGGKVAGYSTEKTYIVLSPQLLRDAVQQVRLSLAATEFPLVYDERVEGGEGDTVADGNVGDVAPGGCKYDPFELSFSDSWEPSARELFSSYLEAPCL